MPDKDPRYEVEDEDIKLLLESIGLRLKEAMPKGWGFSLFIFEFEPNDSCFYMSSAARKDMIKMLKTFIQRQEAN